MHNPARIEGSDAGAALVELTIVALLFILSVMGGLELLIANFRQNSLTHTINNTGRWAILGEQDPGKSREESIQNRIISAAASFGVSLSDPDILICPSDTPNCANDDVGGGGAYFSIKVDAPVRRLLGIYPVKLHASAIFRTG